MAIISATLEDVEFDDHARVYYGGNLIYTGSTGWGGSCELSNSWVDHPNRDVTYAFTVRATKSSNRKPWLVVMVKVIPGFGSAMICRN